MIKQALEYREQLKKLYESECAKQGKQPKTFTQSEATWSGSVDMWLGPTEQLEAEGLAVCLLYFFLQSVF